MILLGQHLIMFPPEAFLKDRQSALNPFFRNQFIERCRPGTDIHRFFPLYFHKGKQVLCHSCPVTVDLLQFFFRESFITTNKTFFPSLRAANTQRQHIIFQQIHLFRLHTGQTAPQVPEHRFVREILLRNLQQRPDEFYKGILQDAALIVQEAGDLIIRQYSLQHRAVALHVSGNQGKIPVVIILLPNQLPDPAGGPGDLFLRIFENMKADLVGCHFILHFALRRIVRTRLCIRLGCLRISLPSQPEQILLKPPKLPARCKPALLPGVYPDGLLLPDIHFLGQSLQPCHRLLTQVKKLVLSLHMIGILPLVDGHSHHNLLCVQHQLLHQLILNRREAGKAVQHNDALPDHL